MTETTFDDISQVDSCGCGAPLQDEQAATQNTAETGPCPLSAITEIKLKDADGVEVVASSLWAKQPALILAIRRPGCLLCREQATKVWALKSQFDDLQVRLVVVLHEWIEAEVKAFATEIWPGEIYHDEAKGFYAALGQGEVKKGNLLSLLNPFGAMWRNIRRVQKSGLVKNHNIVGDGTTLGGLLIVKRADLGVQYMYPEYNFGEHAPLDEVLEAAKAASAARINWLMRSSKQSGSGAGACRLPSHQ